MKHYNYFIAVLLLLPVLMGCHKRQFFEDRDDPGLSRFTSRSYNTTTAYINGKAWISGFSSLSGADPTDIFLDNNTIGKDTLSIRWSGGFGLTSSFGSSITFSLPVKANFTRNDLLDWSNKRFPADTTTVTVFYNGRSPNSGSFVSGRGTGKIYFVNIASMPVDQNGSSPGIRISGLFEGNIGDSVIISKGRFDYNVRPLLP